MPKIIVTGSDGRFGKILQSLNKQFIFKNKKRTSLRHPYNSDITLFLKLQILQTHHFHIANHGFTQS